MAALLLLLTSCSSGGQVMDGEDMVRSYTQISQDEAKQMMEQDGTQISLFTAAAATAASRLHRSFLIWVIPMSMSSAGSMAGPGKS